VTLPPTVAACLTETRPLYEDIQSLRRRRDELATVDQARAAFEELLADESRALQECQRRRGELELALRRWAVEDELPAEGEEGPAVVPEPTPRRSAEPRPVRTGPPAAPPPARPSRQRLKRLVNRWAFAWHLDGPLLGEVNRIVDDAARSLGEALALLEWAVYERPTSPQEGEAGHRARLLEWAAALREYREQLASEVGMLENRYRGYLGIWELWRRRGEGDAAAARWQAFVAEKRRLLRADIEKARRVVEELEQRARARGDRA
jgi:hypothetical protein